MPNYRHSVRHRRGVVRRRASRVRGIAIFRTLYFVPSVGPVSYAFACLLITLSGIAVGIILSFRFLNRLNP